jgi:L-aspartate oxidase
LEAGAGASLPEAARILAEEGPAAWKTCFYRKQASASTAKRAANWLSDRRRPTPAAASCMSATAPAAALEGLAADIARQPNIELLTNATAVDLITYPHHSRDPLDTYEPVTCYGAYVFDRNGRAIHRTLAGHHPGNRRAGSHLPQHHQPPGARGDGLAMAHRAGRASSTLSTSSSTRRRWRCRAQRVS